MFTMMAENVDTVKELFKSVDQSGAASYVKNAFFLIPFAGATHLIALGFLGGAVIMSDVRNLGIGLQSASPAQQNARMRPWLAIAAAVLIASGITLGLGEVMRLFNSPPFWAKMAGLGAALLFTFGARDSVVQNDGRIGPVAGAFGVVALALFGYTFITVFGPLAMMMFGLLVALLAAAVFLLGGENRPALNVRLVSAISIILWFVTALAGRWIAFW